MSGVRISVVVPVYNGEQVIGPCIESLLAMDYPRDARELIIVDNASTDRTAAVIARFPVTGLSEQTRGASAARNAGVRAASGAIVAFTDADCVVDRDWATQIEASFEDPRVDALMGFASGINETVFAELAQRRWEDAWYRREAGGITLKRKAVDTRNCAVRKHVLETCGGFDVSFLGCEDLELSIRLNRAGYHIAFNRAVRVRHRGPVSFEVSLRKSRARMPDVLRLLERFPGHERGDDFPYPASAFYGAARLELDGLGLRLAIAVLRFIRLCVGAAFRLCLVLCPRRALTLKLYKVFFGVSYDAAILDARRERLSVSQR